MYLIDPEELKSAIGLTGSQGQSTLEVGQILAIIKNLTPTIEGVLNVESLAYTSNTDLFGPFNPVMQYTPRPVLRLTNAFVDALTVEVTDPTGAVVAPENLLIDAYYGTIQLVSHIAGNYKVNYRAGFKLPVIPEPTIADPNPIIPVQIYENVPLFIKSAIIAEFTLFARTVLIAARLPKDTTMVEAEFVLRRRIASTIYSCYDRPRAGVHWPTYHKQS